MPGLSGLLGLLGAEVAWTPAALSGLVAAPVVSLMRAAGTLWQNAAKTESATTGGHLVRVPKDTFGTRLEFPSPSDAARSVLTQDGSGRWCLRFDGNSTCHVSATGGDLPGDLTLWVAAKIRALSDYSSVIGVGNGGVTAQRRAVAQRGGGAGRRLEFNGNSADSLNSSNQPIWTLDPTDPQRVVVTRTGQTIEAYLDGVAVPMSAPSGTLVSFATTAITVGCTPATGVEFTAMDLYAWGVCSGVMPAAEVALLDVYLSRPGAFI